MAALFGQDLKRVIRTYFTRINVVNCNASYYPVLFMLEHAFGEAYETQTYVSKSSSNSGITSYRNLNKVVIKDLYLEKAMSLRNIFIILLGSMIFRSATLQSTT
jgi:hypothetical protein